VFAEKLALRVPDTYDIRKMLLVVATRAERAARLMNSTRRYDDAIDSQFQQHTFSFLMYIQLESYNPSPSEQFGSQYW